MIRMWQWKYTRKVSVDKYGEPTYEQVAQGEFEATDTNIAKSKATRIVKKIDPLIKAYPDKWKAAWMPEIGQWSRAKNMTFTAFTKRPFYPFNELHMIYDPWHREEILIEQI